MNQYSIIDTTEDSEEEICRIFSGNNIITTDFINQIKISGLQINDKTELSISFNKTVNECNIYEEFFIDILYLDYKCQERTAATGSSISGIFQ